MATRNQLKYDKKKLIVQSAVHVFSRKGYTIATVADVAAAARIGKGTIYEYFNSKEDLFYAVFEWYRLKTEEATRVDLSVLEGSAAKKLEALSMSLVGMWEEIKDVFNLTLEFWAASSTLQHQDRFKENFRHTYHKFRGIVKSLIREGIERGEFRPDIDPAYVAAAMVGAWDALFLQAWFDPDFEPAATAAEFITVVLRGLACK